MITVPQKIDYNDLMTGVYKALPDRSDLPFDTGARAEAARELAHYLILDRIPALNVKEEINRAADRLMSSYKEVDFKVKSLMDENGRFDQQDVTAINNYIERHLGNTVIERGKTHTIAQIRDEAIAHHYPNLEKLGLQFSEFNPKPYRSSLIVPLLLQRVEGLEASSEVKDAVQKLEDSYKDVPKADGTKVNTKEAQTIARVAKEKTESAMATLLGPNIHCLAA